MDVAYPVGVKRETPDQLAWSIRSVVAHFPVDRVFLAGHLPGWASSEVVHLPTKQDSTKFVNIGRNLEATLASDISDRFLWMNDDFFFLQDFGEDIPLYSRDQRFDYFCAKLERNVGGSSRATRPRRPRSPNLRGYINGMISQKEMLRKMGINTSEPINTDAHIPIPIEKKRLIRVLSEVKATFPQHDIGHFRALYGNWPPQMEGITPLRDPKIMTTKKGIPEDGRPFVSTNGRSWNGPLGEALREMFSKPTRFEL